MALVFNFLLGVEIVENYVLDLLIWKLCRDGRCNSLYGVMFCPTLETRWHRSGSTNICHDCSFET